MAMIEIPDGTIYERIRIWQHRAKALPSPKDWEEYGQTVELLTELLQRRQADRIPIEGTIGDSETRCNLSAIHRGVTSTSPESDSK